MKRNWDTIREILKLLEDAPPEEQSQRLAGIPSERAFEIASHLELILESGLVAGQLPRTAAPGAPDLLALRLTWQGHEFLDAIRSDLVWQRTKKSFANSGLAMTADRIRAVADGIAASVLKSPLTG
jgi:hypothetical protein